MTKNARLEDPRAAADCFASVLDAEAQAREAIRHCRDRHDEAIRQAQGAAARIRERAQGRVGKIQAAIARRIQALPQTPMTSAPAAGNATPAEQDEQLQAAVNTLAARLTGEAG